MESPLCRRRARRRESGQALVEAALVLPLMIVMVLGTLQLFLLLQARIMAQYAVFNAARAGSLNLGSCAAARDAAILALIPTILDGSHAPIVSAGGVPSAPALAAAFKAYQGNRYTAGAKQQIIEMVREQPAAGSVPVLDVDFDTPWEASNSVAGAYAAGRDWRFELRMVYWYRMNIPFANWLLEHVFLANFGIQAAPAFDPFDVTNKNPVWNATTTLKDEGWPGGALAGNMNTWASANDYMFPVEVTASVPMMTPPSAAALAIPCPF